MYYTVDALFKRFPKTLVIAILKYLLENNILELLTSKLPFHPVYMKLFFTL